MLKLFLMEVTPLLEKVNFERAFSLVDEDRRGKIQTLKQSQDKIRSLAAGLLLAYAVNEEACVEEEMVMPKWITVSCALNALENRSDTFRKNSRQIKRTPGGKPYIDHNRGLFFNLSHSGDYAACVLADTEVGVDIQQIKPIKSAGLAKRILAKKEAGELLQIWSAKEAYVKYTGEGLSKDFRELITDFTRGTITDIKSGEVKQLMQLNVLPDYVLSICV